MTRYVGRHVDGGIGDGEWVGNGDGPGQCEGFCSGMKNHDHSMGSPHSKLFSRFGGHRESHSASHTAFVFAIVSKKAFHGPLNASGYRSCTKIHAHATTAIAAT